jgi:hypothetical protein
MTDSKIKHLKNRKSVTASLALFAILLTLFTSNPASSANQPRKILTGWIPYWSIKTSLPAVVNNADLIKEETLELATTPKTTLKPNTKLPIRPLSQFERNMIIHDAKKRAAGWSILFDFLTPFYYALRSPKKLAYNRPEVLNKTIDLLHDSILY